MCMVAGERRNAIEGVGEKKRDGDQKEMDRQYRKSIRKVSAWLGCCITIIGKLH